MRKRKKAKIVNNDQRKEKAPAQPSNYIIHNTTTRKLRKGKHRNMPVKNKQTTLEHLSSEH